MLMSSNLVSRFLMLCDVMLAVKVQRILKFS